MLPTPDTSHVPFARVYEPAEDSYLLLDTLSAESETSFLQSRFGPPWTSSTGEKKSPLPPLVLEVGTGSGVVVAFIVAQASRLFGTRDVLAAGVDVNAFACRATNGTVRRAQQDNPDTSARCWLGASMGDLAAPFKKGSVDVVIFNPPYVPSEALPVPPAGQSRGGDDQGCTLPGSNPSPGRAAAATAGNVLTGVTDKTPTFDEDSYLLALSYAGGRDGMETTERLIDALPGLLSARGCAYVLLCAQNKPEEVKARVRLLGPIWRVLTVGTSGKQAGWEKLQIIRIWRDEEQHGEDTAEG